MSTEKPNKQAEPEAGNILISSKVRFRVIIAFLIGLFAALIIVLSGRFIFAPILGWDSAAIVYLFLVWSEIWSMDSKLTKENAKNEDPSSSTAHAILLTAALASLAAVGFILTKTSSGSTGQNVVLALFAIS